MNVSFPGIGKEQKGAGEVRVTRTRVETEDTTKVPVPVRTGSKKGSFMEFPSLVSEGSKNKKNHRPRS